MALKPGQFTIGGQTFTAKSLKVNYESLVSDDSGRTADGTMSITWVYRSLPKIEIEMPPMSAVQVSNLLELVQGQVYNITYYDPITLGDRTVEVYTSSSSADVYNGLMNNLTGLWQGVSFSAIGTKGER